MKHLRKHNIHYSTIDEIKSVIKDISLDLSDQGITIDIFKISSLNTIAYILHKNDFRYKDISDTIDHVVNYLKEEGYILSYIAYKLVNNHRYFTKYYFEYELDNKSFTFCKDSYQDDLKGLYFADNFKMEFIKQ